MTQQSDEELMGQYKLGNYAAFEELYARHSARAYGYLLSKTGNVAVAQDLLQVSFLKLHENRDRYDGRFKFLPWFFTIVQNNMRDHFRGQKTRREVPIEAAEFLAVPPPASRSELDLENMKLSDQQKLALRLRFEQDLEFGEIAKRLNASPTNVRQLISRAIRKIRGES